MPNINKVVYGGNTLIDLTDSTLNAANQIASGVTAYDRSGTKLTGTLVVDSTYSVTKNLTDVSSSADDTKVIAGNSFFTRLAPIPNNYVISSITVTMGGVDVTSQVFHPDEGGGGGSTLGTKSISANGTYNASSDNLDGYSQVTVAVPNSYSSSDEGKVVSSGALVSQTSSSTSTNGTVDTTTINSLTVSVPTGTARTSSDLTVSGATVTAPAGLYASAVSKTVASGTAGTPTATKGNVSNHAVAVTPSVTNTTGYITGSTKTGTAVTVSASELVSGSETKTQNGTYDVTNLAELVVDVSGGGSVNVGTKTVANSAATNTSISFTGLAGTPKAFFVRLTTTVTRNSSYRYYYVVDIRWDGSSSGGLAGHRWYMYNGQYSNITSGYSYSYSNGTLTVSSSGGQSTSPGAFYNGTYELVYVY